MDVNDEFLEAVREAERMCRTLKVDVAILPGPVVEPVFSAETKFAALEIFKYQRAEQPMTFVNMKVRNRA